MNGVAAIMAIPVALSTLAVWFVFTVLEVQTTLGATAGWAIVFLMTIFAALISWFFLIAALNA